MSGVETGAPAAKTVLKAVVSPHTAIDGKGDVKKQLFIESFHRKTVKNSKSRLLSRSLQHP